jgi:S1-C subfamily serine protease
MTHTARTSRRRLWPAFATCAAVLAVGTATFSFGRMSVGQVGGADSTEPRTVAPRGPLLPEEQANINLFQKASPSVVYINTMRKVVRRTPFGRAVEEVDGTGSGFVWDRKGHIITNYHVVENADTADIVFASGRSYPARLVGFAPDEDLAVLKIDAPASELTPIPVGTSFDVQVGQRVYAIGNPFGLDQTLTVGVLSAVGRSFMSRAGFEINDVLQTDAAINPGNSGGPLLDSAGRLIGVNTAIRSATRSSAGVGFAVPVDRVNEVVPQLIKGGLRQPPLIGITPVSRRIASRLGIDRGILIASVVPDSGAEQAGIRPTTRRDGSREISLGDVILRVEDAEVDDIPDLRRVLSGYEPGDTVTVTLLRGGTEVEIPVTLDDAERF